jgi:hypothetical protein
MSDSNMLTVSFGTWMELPNLKMCDWKPSLVDNAETRVTVATVAQYYQDYVRYTYRDTDKKADRQNRHR